MLQVAQRVAQCRCPSATRAFSSTASRSGRNHIGRAPIPLPPTVSITRNASSITVSGPLGTENVPTEPFISLSESTEESTKYLSLLAEDPTEKKQRQIWGTTRTLVANAVTGLTDGFKLPVYLVGVGYRAALEQDPRTKGQRLNMKLGYACQGSKFIPIPQDVQVKVPIPTKIELFCTNKEKIGQFAANIRMLRKPEPYKGKVSHELVATENVLLIL
jgi:large subunit ribosomal protein L6